MPRVSYYLGRWIRGTDWYPDYQLRLYDRRVGRFNGKRVHESVELANGRPATLQHDLQHYPYRDISDHVTSIDHYTTLAAEEWFAEGRRTNPLEIALHPPAAFLRNYIAPARLSRRRGGLPDLDPQLVLRLPEDPEALGAAARPSHAGPGDAPGASSARRRPKFARTPNVDGRTPVGSGPIPRPITRARRRACRPSTVCTSAVDVLAPHRHGADVARRPEPGARHRAGPAGARPSRRCSSRTRAASCGSARRRGWT